MRPRPITTPICPLICPIRTVSKRFSNTMLDGGGDGNCFHSVGQLPFGEHSHFAPNTGTRAKWSFISCHAPAYIRFRTDWSKSGQVPLLLYQLTWLASYSEQILLSVISSSSFTQPTLSFVYAVNLTQFCLSHCQCNIDSSTGYSAGIFNVKSEVIWKVKQRQALIWKFIL